MVELACVAGTLLAFLAALRVQRRAGSPLANPTLLAVLVVGGVLLAVDLDYARYADATEPVSFLLGPAVVALAVPLHQERETLLAHGRALVAGAVLGALAAVALGLLATEVLALDDAFGLAVTTRTATSPISIALAEELRGGAPALSAVMSIVSGIAGATLGPLALDRAGVRLPVARGLATGVSAHGIGTARMLGESRAAGASSSVGMGLGGLAVALVVPGVWG